MKRLIWLPVAGFLLVAGAAVAAAAPGLVDSAGDLLNNQDSGATPSSSPSSSDGSEEINVEDGKRGLHFAIGGEGSLLDEVLDDLVSTGVITQAQADAISEGLTDKAEEKRAEFEAQRQQMEEMMAQIRTFLEDGVISADELAQLPDDNPFSNVSDILADGQITQEELESVGPFGGFFRHMDGPGRGGHFRGPGGPGWLPAPDAAPDAAPDSSNDSDSGTGSSS